MQGGISRAGLEPQGLAPPFLLLYLLWVSTPDLLSLPPNQQKPYSAPGPNESGAPALPGLFHAQTFCSDGRGSLEDGLFPESVVKAAWPHSGDTGSQRMHRWAFRSLDSTFFSLFKSH